MAIALLAGVFGLLLWPLEDPGAKWRAFLDGMHFPVFLVVGMVIYRLTRGRSGARRRLVTAMATGLVAVVAIELLQPLAGRSGTWRDAVWGGLGIVAGACGAALVGRGAPSKRGFFRLGVIALTLVAFVPFFRLQLAGVMRDALFPVLGGFEYAVETAFWIPQGGEGRRRTAVRRVREHVAAGEFALRVATARGGYAGVALETGDQDWSGFNALRCHLYCEGEEGFLLGIRIDGADDRFSKAVEVMPGANDLRIDLKNEPRTVLKSVRRLVLYTKLEAPPVVFYLDRVRLAGAR